MAMVKSLFCFAFTVVWRVFGCGYVVLPIAMTAGGPGGGGGFLDAPPSMLTPGGDDEDRPRQVSVDDGMAGLDL